MPATRAHTADTPPVVLTKRHEEILRAVYFYRYMTTQDVASRLFSSSSRSYAGKFLSALSGGGDGHRNQYLYRFPVPDGSRNPERVYTLGSRGRDFLAEECGLPVDWYFRPEKVKHLSYGHVLHHLTLTRFLVAAHRWSATQPAFQLAKTRISYELATAPARVTLEREKQTVTLPVIPDAWLLFEELQNGAHHRWFPVLLEIDRGRSTSRSSSSMCAAALS